MEELSLHIMDIAQNSITAGASEVGIEVVEKPEEDTLSITITDNGCGMDEKTVARVTDPFTTGRTTRRVGLGIPLFKLAAEQTLGSFKIESEVGVGTTVRAVFGYSHIDRQPLGDMVSTIQQLVTAHENVDFIYTHRVADKEFVLDTREVKQILGGVSLGELEVMAWLLEFLKENEQELYIERKELGE